MEINKKPLKINQTLYENFAESPSECEMIIPDYLPDITKVLRCEATCLVHSKRVVNEKVVLDGNVEFRVMYLCEDMKNIKIITQTTDFNQSFDVKNISDVDIVRYKIKTHSAVCRVISPRKAMLKCVVSVALKVSGAKQVDMICLDDENNIETLKRKEKMFCILCSNEKYFNINEEAVISAGSMSASYILRNDYCVSFDESKIIAGKVIVRGMLNVKSLYAIDNGSQIDNISSSFPFSQIIDMDSINETHNVDIKLEVVDFRAMLKENESGEGRVIEYDVNVLASARGYTNNETEFTTDAYSLDYESEVSVKPICIERATDNINATYICKESIDVSDNISSVLCTTAVPTIRNVSIDENELKINGVLSASVLYLTAENDCMNIDKDIPFTYSCNTKEVCDSMRCEADIVCLSCTYNISAANKIDIRCEMQVSALVFGSSEINVINEIKVDNTKAVYSKDTPVITLYYPKPGEKLWNIAKKYNAKSKQIRIANSIDDNDEKLSRMLIIPRKNNNYIK